MKPITRAKKKGPCPYCADGWHVGLDITEKQAKAMRRREAMKNMKRIGWVGMDAGPRFGVRLYLTKQAVSDLYDKAIPVYIDPKDLRAKKKG